MAEHKTDTEVGNYKDTLNLPRTDFPIRPTPLIDDPAMIERWQKEGLFQASFYHNEGNTKFILHDGPPYANGHLHLGHAYNKILKDIVTKSQRMLGKHVPVTPGWDCHGLPIELKVSQEFPGLPPAELKKKCRDFATHWVNVQRQEFKQLGVLTNWDHPYLTMSFDYEASILRAFGDFLKQGYIQRKLKTVPWCFSCKTVLATAEIEYQDRKDPSVYVLFALTAAATKALAPELGEKQLNLLVWTTTPWTLPLNRAVMIKPGATYVVMDVRGTYVIVAKDLAAKVAGLLQVEPTIIATFPAEQLQQSAQKAQHPFIAGLQVPILLEHGVTLEDGTACVHCAPGCGPEDYEVGVRNGLEVFSPLSPDGRYTAEVQPEELRDMPIVDGQIWVIKALAAANKLLFKNNITHSYPHCWRCHTGLMFRATKQWFCDLEQHGLKEATLAAINTIETIPKKSSNRLQATVEGRLEWCLSRQRIWGVPIPALLCANCDHTYITTELVQAVAKEVARHGIEYWDTVPVSDIVGKIACEKCQGTSFTKEKDILDVWFDSGVSHYAVLKQNKELAFPADMYLEGKDQHRGWFQSSLLTSMVIEKQPCMKTIVTHGFTVDKDGKKMSKSLGNVVAPQDIVKQLGTDGLRLWASSINLEGEAVVSEILLQNVAQVLRKIRNTCRFLLLNLYDFKQSTDALPLDQLLPIDQYALQDVVVLSNDIIKRYQEYDLTAVMHLLADYCAVNLSAFYLDIIKDRLYVERAQGRERRSAQTACWYILDVLTKLIAPIMSFNAESIADHYQENKTSSIHLQSFASVDVLATPMPVLTKGEKELLHKLRGAFLKVIEGERQKGIIKHSLEAHVYVYIDFSHEDLKPLKKFLYYAQERGQSLTDFFKEFLIVSRCTIQTSPHGLQPSEIDGLSVQVTRVEGYKCPRCWQWGPWGSDVALCDRCKAIVEDL